MEIFNKFKLALQRTKTRLVRDIQSAFKETGEWDDQSYERLEEILISADLGVQISNHVVNEIRDQYDRGLIHTSADIIDSTKRIFYEMFEQKDKNLGTSHSIIPTVYMLVGVNGSGKTTTAGKLAFQLKEEGKSLILAACDTFRAAAVDQLKIWGERVNSPVISSKIGADAASVAFDSVNAAIARDSDCLIIDTAGRQHTKKGLMDELAKISRTISKAHPGAPHETWLVVDGSTGTNAIQQARVFNESVSLNGICITKLDGSSKGGVVVAIHKELKIPIRFIGLGEGLTDLQPFNSKVFIDALFAR